MAMSEPCSAGVLLENGFVGCAFGSLPQMNVDDVTGFHEIVAVGFASPLPVFRSHDDGCVADSGADFEGKD